jgi:hypothetical protein
MTPIRYFLKVAKAVDYQADKISLLTIDFELPKNFVTHRMVDEIEAIVLRYTKMAKIKEASNE